MLELLQTVGWIACVVYATIPSFWLLIHPRAEYWRARSRSPYRILIPLWIGMWILLGLITAPWRDISLYSARWTWLPAALFFFAGMWLYKRSGGEFSSSVLGGLPELVRGHRDQRLITSGIRNRVRHPIYLGHLCAMLAWTIGTGLAVCCVLTVFAVLTGAIMIQLEEKELEQRFGAEYREYRQRVPAVFPSLRI